MAREWAASPPAIRFQVLVLLATTMHMCERSTGTSTVDGACSDEHASCGQRISSRPSHVRALLAPGGGVGGGEAARPRPQLPARARELIKETPKWALEGHQIHQRRNRKID